MYRTGAAIASAIPDALLLPAASAAGFAVGRLNARKRSVVRRNVWRASGGTAVERNVDEAFRTYARYWVEALRIPKPGLDEIRRRTTMEGLEPMEDHLRAGRGVIFVTPHVGNYDMAAAWLAGRGWRVVAVAEELEPPAVYDLFVELRRSVGVEILPHGRVSTAAALLRALREGAIVGLVADRDISGSGVEVEFCGEKTYLPAGPAVLAYRTGAPLAVGALYQRPHGRYHGVLLPPIPVEKSRASAEEIQTLTQRVARDLETLVRRAPGQWHMFQPNWPSDPGYHHFPASRG